MIVFRDDGWPYGKASRTRTQSSRTLGLTMVTFDKKAGEVWDADMQLNAFDSTVNRSPLVHDSIIVPQPYDASIVRADPAPVDRMHHPA